MTKDGNISDSKYCFVWWKTFLSSRITSVLVLSVQQDFNGCDCAGQQKRLSGGNCVGFFLVYKMKTKFVAGKLCVEILLDYFLCIKRRLSLPLENYGLNSMCDARFEMCSFFQYLLTFAMIFFPYAWLCWKIPLKYCLELGRTRRRIPAKFFFFFVDYHTKGLFNGLLNRKQCFLENLDFHNFDSIFDTTEKGQINLFDPITFGFEGQ